MHYIYHEFEKIISTKRMLATRVLSISESLQVKKESDPKEWTLSSAHLVSFDEIRSHRYKPI